MMFVRQQHVETRTREREKNKMKLATNRDLFFYSVLYMSNVSLAFFS